jgi:hypothetical protein
MLWGGFIAFIAAAKMMMCMMRSGSSPGAIGF